VQWSGSPPPDPTNWDTITYTYDPAGRRIKKNVVGSYIVKYVYDGGHVIAEYDDSGLLRKYIYGARVDEPVCMLENPASDGIDVADSNAAYYYHFDGLGSVVALSNSNGDSCQSYEYSAYGQVAASDPDFIANPYMFTGRRFDIETGLYYYRARYYNPHIGRFMQTDPVGYGAGINWYLYCRNNPLNFMDPSGLREVTDEELGYLYKIRDSLSELVAAGYGSDVEALAYLSDCVVVYSGSGTDDVGDYVDTFMKVASARIFDLSLNSILAGFQKLNPNYETGTFSDHGFKEEYQQELPNDEKREPGKRYAGHDQFTHFVGFIGAGFYTPMGWIAEYYVEYFWERGEDNADVALGLMAVNVGMSLAAYDSSDFLPHGGLQFSCPLCNNPNCPGIAPSQVGDWILNNLKE